MRPYLIVGLLVLMVVSSVVLGANEEEQDLSEALDKLLAPKSAKEKTPPASTPKPAPKPAPTKKPVVKVAPKPAPKPATTPVKVQVTPAKPAATVKPAKPAAPARPVEITPAPAKPKIKVAPAAELPKAPKRMWHPASDAMLAQPPLPKGVKPYQLPFHNAPAGQAFDVVYIIDHSASLIGYWAWVQSDLVSSINNLQQDWTFNVISFASTDDTLETPNSNMDQATPGNCQTACNFVNNLKPRGNTHPHKAVKLALQLLNSQPDKTRQKVIFLVSDGLFPKPHALVQLLKQENADQSVKVYTMLYGDPMPRAQGAMKRIAADNAGRFVHVTSLPLQ